MLFYTWILFVIILPCFEMNMKNCIEYAQNHTICTTLESCKAEMCDSYKCEYIPAIHFRNIAVILNKSLRKKSEIKEQLNPLLHDPLLTSIFTQREPSIHCGKENKLLKNVRIKVIRSEGIFEQLLQKAYFQQQRYLYAQNDCLNMCNIMGINLQCELVPNDDLEVIKTASFKHLQHMIFFQCGEFPMLIIVTVIMVILLTTIVILELVLGISRIHAAKKRIKEKDDLSRERSSMSSTKSQMGISVSKETID